MELGYFAYNVYVINKWNNDRNIKPQTNTNVIIQQLNDASGIKNPIDFNLVNPDKSKAGLVTSFVNSTAFIHKILYSDALTETAPSVSNITAGGKRIVNFYPGSVFSIMWTGDRWINFSAPGVGDYFEQHSGQAIPGDVYPFTYWVDVSDLYKDQFFRVKGTGGNAVDVAGYDQPVISQNANIPYLEGSLKFQDGDEKIVMDAVVDNDLNSFSSVTNEYPRGFTSFKDSQGALLSGVTEVKWKPIGYDTNSKVPGTSSTLANIYSSDVGLQDLRPYNSSIKLWKRTN